MGKHRSNDLKEAVVDFYLRMPRKSIEKTAEVFQIPYETVRRWLERYEEEGDVKYKYRGSMSYKIEQEHFDFIKQLVTNNKDIYLHEVRKRLLERFPELSITSRHLSRVVKDIPYSRKNWTKIHYPKQRYGKELDLEQDKKAFFFKLKQYKLEDIIALDETSIQIGISRGKARCYIGQRCIKKTDDNAIFQRFSLLMAISMEKIEGWMLKKGAVQNEDLQKFLDQILSKKDKKHLIILDNAPIHKKDTDPFVRRKGHDLLYILPYQHYLNPIENLFSQLKHYMKDKVPMNEKEVREAIEYAIGKISKKHLINYFLNAYNPELLKKKEAPIRREPKKKYKNGYESE